MEVLQAPSASSFVPPSLKMAGECDTNCFCIRMVAAVKQRTIEIKKKNRKEARSQVKSVATMIEMVVLGFKRISEHA